MNERINDQADDIGEHQPKLAYRWIEQQASERRNQWIGDRIDEVLEAVGLARAHQFQSDEEADQSID